MKRRLFAISAAASLAVAFLLLGLWIRGRYVADYLTYEEQNRRLTIASREGYFAVDFLATLPFSNPMAPGLVFITAVQNNGWSYVRSSSTADPQGQLQRFAIARTTAIPSFRFAGNGIGFNINTHLLPVIFLSTALPLFWLLRKYRLRNWANEFIGVVDQTDLKTSTLQISAILGVSAVFVLMLGGLMLGPAPGAKTVAADWFNLAVFTISVMAAHVWVWLRWTELTPPVDDAARHDRNNIKSTSARDAADSAAPTVAAVGTSGAAIEYAITHRFANGLSTGARLALAAVIIQQIVALAVAAKIDSRLVPSLPACILAVIAYWISLIVITLSRHDDPMTRADALLVNAGFWLAALVMSAILLLFMFG